MPNWYHNTLKVEEGKAKEIFNFVASPERAFDFHKVVPMPEELDIAESTTGSEGEAALYGQNIEEVLEWIRHKGKGIDTQEKLLEYLKSKECPYTEEALSLGEKYHSNRKKYGFPTWYEWRYHNWGTKWNAVEVVKKVNETGEEVLHFDTANGVPLPILEKVSKQFPEATICLYINSIDSMCEGFVKWKNGEVLEDEYRELNYEEVFSTP